MVVQIDNKIESINQENHMTLRRNGKQVCDMYPNCSNQIGQYLKMLPIGDNVDINSLLLRHSTGLVFHWARNGIQILLGEVCQKRVEITCCCTETIQKTPI